jgi:hypothetical protein
MESIESALKAITNIQEIPSTSTADVVTTTKMDSKAFLKFRRCKSEYCINLKRQLPETSKLILKGLQSIIIKEEEEQQN